MFLRFGFRVSGVKVYTVCCDRACGVLWVCTHSLDLKKEPTFLRAYGVYEVHVMGMKVFSGFLRAYECGH